MTDGQRSSRERGRKRENERGRGRQRERERERLREDIGLNGRDGKIISFPLDPLPPPHPIIRVCDAKMPSG